MNVIRPSQTRENLPGRRASGGRCAKSIGRGQRVAHQDEPQENERRCGLTIDRVRLPADENARI